MTAKGHIRKTISLKIGTTQHECEVTGSTLTPSSDVQTTQVLCPDGALSDTGPVSWTLDLDYLVDYTAGSLFRFLTDQHGKTAEFTYEPDPDNAPGVVYTGNVRVVAGPGGGSAAAWESGSVSLPVIGTPTITDPVAPPEAVAAEAVPV